jgi:hypothetical protein
VSAKHTLAARLRDLLIELELWVVAWLATSTILAASIYLYLQPVVNASLWRNYLVAHILDIVGLGMVSFPGWYTPDLVIQFVREKLPPELVTTWDHDFAMFLQSPVYALVVLPLAYLVFFDKKA